MCIDIRTDTVWEITTPSARFCYTPKTAFKKKTKFIKKTQVSSKLLPTNSWAHCATLCLHSGLRGPRLFLRAPFQHGTGLGPQITFSSFLLWLLQHNMVPGHRVTKWLWEFFNIKVKHKLQIQTGSSAVTLHSSQLTLRGWHRPYQGDTSHSRHPLYFLGLNCK